MYIGTGGGFGVCRQQQVHLDSQDWWAHRVQLAAGQTCRMQQLLQQVSINAKLQAWLALQQQWPPPLQPLIHHHPPKFGAFHIGHQYGIFPLTTVLFCSFLCLFSRSWQMKCIDIGYSCAMQTWKGFVMGVSIWSIRDETSVWAEYCLRNGYNAFLCLTNGS